MSGGAEIWRLVNSVTCMDSGSVGMVTGYRFPLNQSSTRQQRGSDVAVHAHDMSYLRRVIGTLG